MIAYWSELQCHHRAALCGGEWGENEPSGGGAMRASSAPCIPAHPLNRRQSIWASGGDGSSQRRSNDH